jgi:putative transposase
MHPELAAQGFLSGRDRIGQLRQELGLRCKQKRKFTATTNSRHELPVAPNLEQQFNPTVPNQQWLVDGTRFGNVVPLS